MRHAVRAAAIVSLLVVAIPLGTAQEGVATDRVIEIRFTPTARAQLALWIEDGDGTFLRTLKLTEGVAYRGIGNRPGATQMNSGFRWPYGRREGVLPHWAHRRAARFGGFPRVIFHGRSSEGRASISGDPAGSNTRDDFFCLSFQSSTTRKEALDAVSCASVFNSNKGRYLTEADLDEGYAEPWEEDGAGSLRVLPLESLYPPRRDAVRCTSGTCRDHEDVALFAEDARRVMPEIDAVTMATLAGDVPALLRFTAPRTWAPGAYVLFLEVAVEGDSNETYDDRTYPTPSRPIDEWDNWAMTFGYPYRGQPSVVYRVPFELTPRGGTFTTDRAAGYTALHGEDGELRPIDGTITDDPRGAPGSGADRLRLADDVRLSVRVRPSDLCAPPEPTEGCGIACTKDEDCPTAGLACGDGGTCVDACSAEVPGPTAVEDLLVTPDPDSKQSHHRALVRFTAPVTRRPVVEYELRFSTHDISDANFDAALEAKRPMENSADCDRLVLFGSGYDGGRGGIGPGETVSETIGCLDPQTRYQIAVRAVDACNRPGPPKVEQVITTEIDFTTVSPCFVATAAYGTPFAREVDALRKFRDRRLATHPLGRLFVRAYEAIGPVLADAIRDRELLRAAARVVLTPFVRLAEWLES